MTPRLATTVAACVWAASMLAGAAGHATDAGMPLDVGQDDAAVIATPSPAIAASLTQLAPAAEPIRVGETVEVTYEITHPAGATITFPKVFTPDRWVLIDARPQSRAVAESATKSTWVATFGIYRPGITTLDPFPIAVTSGGGGSSELTTQPVAAKVISKFADAATEPTFSEPRPPVPVWVEDYTLAYVGSGALLLAMVGLLAWWIRRRQLLQPPPPPPPRAAHEIALEKLGALAGDDLVERGEYMLYWVRLSEAVREYLGRSYGFPGTELTTTEMLAALVAVRWPPGVGLDDIHAFLRRCDEVKFGGSTPGVEESTSTLRRAFSIVELTKPRAPTRRAVSDTLAHEDTEAEEESNDTLQEDSEAPRWAPPASAASSEDEAMDPPSDEGVK